ncbi:MAG: 3-phosphoshikimate 1-carboxyvinyltransferase [Leptospiraceae bacterium]|nr:3-phosphoshikimate 1-carboxyvinyltransferase [Leptospiraceae bacterium]MCP5512304.1 3-phosphoshikimate 1-carboxyvinyltransferase [Leptospiraceae bacterium]
MLESKKEIPSGMQIKVPGDKSVSHRSVLFSSLAKGKSKITGFLEAEDPRNTMKSFSQLGVEFKITSPGEYLVNSPGKHNLKSPNSELDFGNGGTGIRLSAGLLTGLPNFHAVLTGDESLKKRPMKRIIDPLRSMGGDIIALGEDGRAPLEIRGKQLRPFQYKSKLASAQVKSCILLAGISSDVEVDYEESELSRDHTENMIRFLGGKIEKKEHFRFVIKPPYEFEGTEFKVPGDISSAAFFIVLALLSKKGELLIQNIGLNPARVGILTVLKDMGGKIEEENIREECGEKIGDLRIHPSGLKRIDIKPELIPSIIDEIPILTIAGLFSENGFKISHAEDLRAKESDRIHSMVTNLKSMGVKVEESQDGYEFEEVDAIHPALIQSFLDHRIAMSFQILSALTGLDLRIDDDSWIDTSFPDFKNILRSFG